VTDRHNFPTDRYVLEGLAARGGVDVRFVTFDEIDGPTPAEVASAVDDDIALVTLSHVDYRSGALADMATINDVAHRAAAGQHRPHPGRHRFLPGAATGAVARHLTPSPFRAGSSTPEVDELA
jgi:hypothetical protein